MEIKSRVKKYEELRQEILVDNKDQIEEPKLSRFAKRLSNIDAEYFKPIIENYEFESNSIKPVIEVQKPKESHKIDVHDEYYNEQEILARALRISDNNEVNSDDELLNSFLNEIRTYNQRQGIKSLDDTKLEILKQVKVETEEIEEIEEPIREVEKSSIKDSIARQVRELLNQEPYFDRNDEPTENEENIKFDKERIVIEYPSRSDEEINEYRNMLNEERENRSKLLEETQQLRLKLSEHEDELDEIESGIDYTRRLLNVLLALLLITVLIAGGILAYLILRG